ncbi:MAG: hypothetical protein MZV70_08950 [Desulfobacterales bacterium]|nr:hypothetical protein [Desulfobacterales bacterium]
MALLHLLAARAPAWQLRLGIAHLDHGLRAESARDADFVRQLAADLGLDVYMRARRRARASTRDGAFPLEEAGRKARYDFSRRRPNATATARWPWPTTRTTTPRPCC